MTAYSPSRVRFLLVGILTLLALGFALPEVYSQPGRPPIGGRPPGGISGMPGGITGRPPGGISGAGIGGITGRPPGGISGAGISGITGRPPGGISGAGISGITGRPPGGISGISGTGITGISGMPGGIGGSRTETVWTCSKCRRELGRGPNDPGQSSCPYCGVKFSGSTYRPGSIGAMPSIPPVIGGGGPPIGAGSPPVTGGNPPITGGNPTFPASTDRPGEMPALTPNPNPSVPPQATPVTPSATSSTSGDSSSSEKPATSSRSWVIIGLVVAAVLFLAIVGALIIVLKSSSTLEPQTTRIKRGRLEDE